MATIIKDAQRHVRSASPAKSAAFNFADLSGRADEYLEKVRGQAAQIIAGAHQEAEQVRRQAEEAGRVAAQTAIDSLLEEKMGERLATLLPAIQRVAAELENARGLWQQHWEQAAGSLAGAIARRIIRREITQEPTLTLEFLREALGLAAGAEQITVRMHPDDLASLGTHAEQLAAAVGQVGAAEIVGDAEISLGGCRVETRFGEIDMQIESQVARLEQEWSS